MPYPTKHQWERSALSLALVRGDVDVMKVLIERGADVNTQNKVIMQKPTFRPIRNPFKRGFNTSMHVYDVLDCGSLNYAA